MTTYQKITDIFEAVSSPARLQIVLTMGEGEACVCHLEAVLGLRQAYISQQLMVLREKGVISARRDGKYVYYSLQNPGLLEVIRHAAQVAGVVEVPPVNSGEDMCSCPKCLP
jgi:DNA-binding transcriptional ArsR family regulator